LLLSESDVTEKRLEQLLIISSCRNKEASSTIAAIWRDHQGQKFNSAALWIVEGKPQSGFTIYGELPWLFLKPSM